MKLPYTKLIRDGNHFIGFTEGEWQGRWLLIDGPWFDYLESLSRSYHGHIWSVRMRYSPPISTDAYLGDGCSSVSCEIAQTIITWERMRWQPWSKFPKQHNPYIDEYLHQRWYEMASARKKIGWWLPWDDYKVPAYINHLEFVDDYFLAKAMPGTSTSLAYNQRRVTA